eukprot:PhM_4_TR99/c0_g1_i1/m.22978
MVPLEGEDIELESPRAQHDAQRGADGSDNDGTKTSSTTKSTTLGCIAQIANAMIGAGVLGLPYALSRCGVVMGVVFLTVGAWVSLEGMVFLTRACAIVGVDTYEALSDRVSGRLGRNAYRAACIIMNVGVLIAYFRIIGDFFMEVMIAVFGLADDSAWASRVVATLLIALFVVSPFTYLRNTRILDRMSLLSITFNVAFVFSIVFRFLSPHEDQRDVKFSDEIRMVEVSADTVDATATIVFAYACHTVIPTIIQNYENPTIPRITYSCRAAVVFAMAVYVPVALIGYFTFGKCVQDDVISGYVTGDGVLTATRIFMTLSIALTAPMTALPIRTVVLDILRASTGDSRLHALSDRLHYGLTTVLLVSCFTVAIALPSLTVALDFVGSMSAPFVAFIFPFAFFILAARRQSESVHRMSVEEYGVDVVIGDATVELHAGETMSISLLRRCYVLLGIGVLVFISSLFSFFHVAFSHTAGAGGC